MQDLTRRQMFKAMAVTAGVVALGSNARLAVAVPGTEIAPAGAAALTEIRVLAINIFLNGTGLSGGLGMVPNIIKATRANVVLLSETSSATQSLANTLTSGGTKFYAGVAGDTGVLSTFPIIATGKMAWMNKAVLNVDGMEVAAYAAHLNYKYYATYLPRGYGPGNPSGEFSAYGWRKMPAPVTDVETIQRVNMNSGRPQAISDFIADAAKEQAKGRAIIMGGDFNEPSHLDWTDATKNLFDHNGVVIPWESTRRLEEAGFADAYRTQYSNPVTHPGFTWPSDNPAVATSSLTWAPDADERDRIDYIFTDTASSLTLSEVGIVGPRSTIVRNQRVPETSADNFITAPTPWPTDHKAMLAVFQIGTTTPGDAATTTTVAAADSVKKGAEATLTATVDPAPTGGAVQFLDGETSLGGPVDLASGSASITHTFETDGDHAITAVFSGAEGFTASTSAVKTIAVSVDDVVTTTAVTSPGKALVGQGVNLHAQVSPAVHGGTVEFTISGGAKASGAVGTDGVAIAQHTFTAAGTFSVVARYSGTQGVAGSTSPAFPVSVAVAPAADVQTSTTLDLVGTLAKGQPVTLRARVTPNNADGSVRFKLGSIDLSSPVRASNGVATLQTTFAASGTYMVTAEFIGGNGFIDSASDPRELIVPGPSGPPAGPGGLGSLGDLFTSGFGS